MPRKERSQQEQELVEKAFRYLPGGTLGNVSPPLEQAIILRGGRGSKVYDVSGNEYIDYLLGSGPMILGHAHPSVVAAVQEYLEHGSTFFATNEPSVLLAEEIVNAVPCADQVRFTTSGTDATFQCLRLARAFRRRDVILKFEGGYHGMHDYSLMSLAPKVLADFPKPTPGSAGIPQAIADTVLVAPFNDLKTTTDIIEKHRDALAGVIVEPFQRVLSPVPGFLQGLREITQRYQIPLIFDEVVTGFRFAYGGAQEYYGVMPDLAAYGKIMGGGFPLAAIAGREEFMRAYDPQLEGTDGYVPQVGTLSGNPLASVAALATLKELQKPGVYQRLFATGRQLREGLADLLRQAEVPAQVVGENPLFDVYFTDQEIIDYRSTLSSDGKILARFNRTLLEEGVFRGSQKFYVSLAHDEQDVKRTLDAFSRAVETIRTGLA